MITFGNRRPRRSAFSIVELLVVIGIIGLLMGLLLPALSGARKRARKTEELNHLRSIYQAWSMYANFNNDATVPGYLDPEVQERWKVSYEFPDHTNVPPETATTWVWRLLGYLDYGHEPIHFYLREADPSIFSSMEEAQEVAETPAFGYNAVYVGGWWTMESVGGQTAPRARFSSDETGKPLSVVSRSIGSIRRSSDLVVFCSSGFRQTDLQKPVIDQYEGAHYVVPPTVATKPVWSAVPTASVDTIQVFTEDYPVPIGRYTAAVATLYADGHVDAQTIAGLDNMRSWVDVADRPSWQHNP